MLASTAGGALVARTASVPVTPSRNVSKLVAPCSTSATRSLLNPAPNVQLKRTERTCLPRPTQVFQRVACDAYGKAYYMYGEFTIFLLSESVVTPAAMTAPSEFVGVTSAGTLDFTGAGLSTDLVLDNSPAPDWLTRLVDGSNFALSAVSGAAALTVSAGTVSSFVCWDCQLFCLLGPSALLSSTLVCLCICRPSRMTSLRSGLSHCMVSEGSMPL